MLISSSELIIIPISCGISVMSFSPILSTFRLARFLHTQDTQVKQGGEKWRLGEAKSPKFNRTAL